mgnify:FL=1
MNTKERLLTLINRHQVNSEQVQTIVTDDALAQIVHHFRTRTSPHYLFTGEECKA